MSKVVNINDAVVDTDKFRGQYTESQRVLQEMELLQEEFKKLVDTVSKETKLKKPQVAAYFKERYKFKTGDTVKKGEIFQSLNEAVDGE